MIAPAPSVVHISTSDSGGAGIAALRLHQGLLRNGVKSAFLCLDRRRRDVPGVHQIPKHYDRFYERVAAKLGFPLTRRACNARMFPAGLDAEAFSFPWSDQMDLVDHPLVAQADVVHLHWVAGLLDYPSFFRNCPKPIVWTLHDMNPFMGGFHYEGDFERNTTHCEALDRRFVEAKDEALKRIDGLTVVTPSRWLAECSRTSKLLGRFRHEVIPYGLDTSLFRPFAGDLARDVFGLPREKIVLAFVSESLGNPRKGMDILLDALRNAHFSSDVVVAAVGALDIAADESLPLRCVGSIQDERLMALFYSAADAFMLPTREDNLPNVMLESLACGTPVIGTRVGGIPDAVRSGANGLLVPEPSPEALAEAIRTFLDGCVSFSREAIRADAVRRYDLAVSARQYGLLYESILA